MPMAPGARNGGAAASRMTDGVPSPGGSELCRQPVQLQMRAMAARALTAARTGCGSNLALTDTLLL